MKGDSFTANKFRWLDQVAADKSVAPLAFKLAYIVATYINRETGDAWPSQETLAASLGIGVRAVRNASGQLVDAGHVSVMVTRGRGHSNRYRAVLKNRNDGSGIGSKEKRNSGAGIKPIKPERRSKKTGTVEQENRHGRSSNTFY